ncbi:MAG: 50S ribosomal protein L15 [Synergistaceae bacterium]|nr:50S ribosomal protein L15 [Synergistaceae bacterium]
MNLHDLRPAPGARRKAKRLGQGIGSGTGKTSGKGNKGHKSRTGGGVRPGFEGGQMPLARRVPKHGFNNARFAKKYQVVNVESLSKKFENGQEITVETLYNAGLVRSPFQLVKLLAKGFLERSLTVKVNAVSQGARKKIEAMGGKVEVV